MKKDGKLLPDDTGKMTEYLSCPMRFIPACVHDFLDRRADLEKYPHTAKPYDERGARWHAYERYYSSKVREYQELVEKNAG